MSFTESILNAGDFGPGDTEWIHLIIGEWQMIWCYGSLQTMWWLTVAYPIVCRARRSPVISLLSRT